MRAIGMCLVALMSAALPSSSAAGATATIKQSPGKETFITMFADRDEPITRGKQRFVYPGNASDLIGGVIKERHSIDVYARRDPHDSFEFEFAFPKNEPIGVGTYKVERFADCCPSRLPGINIDSAMYEPGNNNPSYAQCDTWQRGRFTVLDIKRKGYRTTRLWMTYEATCRDASPLFGEIRIGMPDDPGDLTVGPHLLRFPTAPVGDARPVTPVRVVNPTESPVSVSSVALTGDSAYAIRNDECSGAVLDADASCAVWVRFDPGSEGNFTSQLAITEETGAVHTTQFSGDVVGTDGSGPSPGHPTGYTTGSGNSFSFVSEPGDFMGQGRQGNYTFNPNSMPHGDDIYATGDYRGVHAQIDSYRGQPNWEIDFIPPVGDVLAPGIEFDDVSKADPDSPGAGLNVTTYGRECDVVEGSFTVNAIRVDPVWDRLLGFSATFVQHCNGSDAAMRGRIDFSS